MGKIITLSGIDGSGKSTCINIIKNLLIETGAKKIASIDSMKPGVFFTALKRDSDDMHKDIREIFSPNLLNVVWTADLIRNYEKTIKPALSDFDYILLHRSELCCRVYSKLFNPDDTSIDCVLNNCCFHYDTSVFLDIAPDIAYERICQRNGASSTPTKESIDMLVRANYLYKEYLDLPKYKDVIRLDSAVSKDILEDQLRKIIQTIVCNNYSSIHSMSICEIIRNTLSLDQSIPIKAETLLSELPFDSLKYIQMIVNIEDEFNVKFEDNELIQSPFTTVQSLVDYVAKLK